MPAASGDTAGREEQTRLVTRATVLRGAVWLGLIATLGYVVAMLFRPFALVDRLPPVGFLALLLVGEMLLRRGWHHLVGSAIVLAVLGLAAWGLWRSGGVATSPVLTLLMATILASLTLSWQLALGSALLATAILTTTALLEHHGLLPPSTYVHRGTSLAIAALVQVTGGGLLLAYSAWTNARALGALERRRRELEQSEAQRSLLAATVEQSSGPVMVTDRHARAVFINAAFEEQTGYTREEVLGEPAWDFRGEVDDDQLERSVLEQLGRSSSWSGLVNGRQREGDDYTLQLTISPVRDGSGEIVNYLLVGRDVTRERALEAQVLHSQRIESLGTLAGGIAHDFNNILAGIFAIVSLALDQAEEGSQLRSDLTDVMQAARRGKQLVAQILAFSRRIEPEMQRVDPVAVVHEAARLLRASIPSSVELDTDLQAVGQIRADPAQLHQVLVNLGTNAYHALPRGEGRIVMRLERLELEEGPAQARGLEAGAHVRLTVADDGSGIPEGIRDRIFEPFFTTKPQGEGSGMGLAVVHGIVKAHRGAIEVTSEVGGGTSLEILLPVGQTSADSEAATSAQRGDERLLLVDDEPLVLKSMRRSLRLFGYEVQAFDSPTEALEALRQRPAHFDGLITDLAMPEKSGAALAREARAISPGLPVLLCTGNIELLLASERRELDLPVLEKPFTPTELASAVRGILDAPAAKTASTSTS